MSNELKLGPTGKFPMGKLNEHDEGELVVGIMIDQNRLVINFGKAVTFVALSRKEVLEFIEVLNKRISELNDA